jgi:2-hydroxymuconate-semialdehyde hydrolase
MSQTTSGAAVADLTVPTAGYDTHLLRAGEGNETAVLVLHGGGMGASAEANWMRTLPVLGEHFDVIAPDLLGFGDTTHPEDPPLGPAAWLALRVDQLMAILDALGHERAVLVGNSLGGALTLATTIRHPERVEKIVLMGSAGPPFAPGPGLARLLTFYEDPTHANLTAILRSFVHDLDAFGDVDALVAARLECALRPEVRRSFDAMFASPDGTPTKAMGPPEEAVRAIAQPALIVHGREDRIVPPEASRWLHERIALSDLALLGRCGHWAMLERPDAFNRLVTDFIRTGEI